MLHHVDVQLAELRTVLHHLFAGASSSLPCAAATSGMVVLHGQFVRAAWSPWSSDVASMDKCGFGKCELFLFNHPVDCGMGSGTHGHAAGGSTVSQQEERGRDLMFVRDSDQLGLQFLFL